MKKQKISFLIATFMGMATLAPVLVSAQSATVNAQIGGTVNGGQMMRGQGENGFGKGMMGRMQVGMNGRGMMPGAAGKVTAISGNTITISEMNRPMKDAATSTKIITIDATNAVIMKNNATTTLSAIVVGDNLMAEGQLNGTNLVATKIRAGMQMKIDKDGANIGGAMQQLQGNGQPVVAGNISAISGNTITITNKSNVSYTVDAKNAKVIVKNATSSIAGLTTGDMIVAQGTVNGNAVVATTIIDQGTPSANPGQNGQGMDNGNHGPNMGAGIFGGIKNFFSHLFGF